MKPAFHSDAINPAPLTNPEKKARRRATPLAFTPLKQETRQTVDTATAAYHLNRASQTLRVWATSTYQKPPITPVRINGRLAWPVAGIKKLLGVTA